MRFPFILFAAALFIVACFSQCKDEQAAAGADLELFNEATATGGFTYYQNDSVIRQSSSPSAHTPYMRIRYNATAQSVLGLDGRLPLGASFPNGSLIVKELYNSSAGELQLYAIMKKDSLNPNAGANWLWAEYYTNSDVIVSITENGSDCVSCHSTDSRDYNRVFNIF